MSVTSRFKYKAHTKRDAAVVPSSALELLRVNKQMHGEAHKLFYQNDLVFSSPVEILDFTCSLGDERLDSLRSLTLFCGELPAAGGTHETGLGGTVLLVRRLKGLQKLHLMLRYRNLYVANALNASGFVDKVDFSKFKDAKMLFTLRGVADVKVHDVDLAKLGEAVDKSLSERHHNARACISRQKSALRHFNHGLRLAQTGVVVQELYTEKGWRNKKTWPALQGSDCGYDKGCSCGVSEVEPDDEVVEIVDDSD